MSKVFPLIEWDSETRRITTEYGTVRYLKFCELEKLRRSDKTRVVIKNGMCCLMPCGKKEKKKINETGNFSVEDSRKQGKFKKNQKLDFSVYE